MSKRQLLGIFVTLFLAAGIAAAQDSPKEENKATTQHVSSGSPQTASSAGFYRLDYTLRELDGSKVVSKRMYTIYARADHRRGQIRSGSRIPVGPPTNKNYIDVGVNIDAYVEEVPAGVSLQTVADVSSIPPDTPEGTSYVVMRQQRGDATLLAQVGKPIIVFSSDDPSTTHRFELEVTVTKVGDKSAK